MKTIQSNDKRAIVIGGSMAGLLAARVLADHFDKVTILERDKTQLASQPRKGVPQGHHSHALLKRGEQIIEGLFPGLMRELVADGSELVDWGQRIRWYHFGGWRPTEEIGLVTVFQSRPKLEWHIRRRLALLPNVNFQYETSVTGLISLADQDRVIGVGTRTGSAYEALYAHLVVDASGRGSKTPQWLEMLGYDKPNTTRYPIDLCYVSRRYRPPANFDHAWAGLSVMSKMPYGTNMGYISTIEGDTWIATMAGYMGEHPDYSDESILRFARSLPKPDVYHAISRAEPISEPQVYKYKASVRQHYEHMHRMPDGLIVMGDAACSFDPVFGQGMTAAAMGADVLAQSLHKATKHSGVNMAGFSMRFQKRLAKMLAAPWMLSTSDTLRFPQLAGKRPIGLKLLHWYTGHIYELANESTDVYRSLLDVMHLVKRPVSLFKPSILARVARRALRKQAISQPDQSRPVAPQMGV